MPWWPERAFEIEHIMPQQTERYEGDPWEETVSEFIVGKPRVTISEVAKNGLFIDTPRIARSDQNRIAAILIGDRLDARQTRRQGRTVLGSSAVLTH